MRGAHAPLAEIARLVEPYRERYAEGVVTVMDDSHGIGAYGATGRGTEEHILGIESDSGVFSPVGFGFTGSDEAFSVVREVGSILEEIGAGAISRGGGGADIGPMMRRGMPGMGLNVDETRYFWYHHTDADTLDKLDPREVARCVAAMAVMAYVIADLPDPLPR